MIPDKKSGNDIHSADKERQNKGGAQHVKILVLYFLASLFFILAVLSQDFLTLDVLAALSAVFFAVIFTITPPVAVLSLIVPLIAALFISRPSAVFAAITLLPTAISLGNSYKSKKRPADALRVAFSFHLAALAVFVFAVAVIYFNGSVPELFSAVGDKIDELFQTVINSLPQEFGELLPMLNKYIGAIKAMLIGILLAFQLFILCLIYFLSLIVAKLFRIEKIETHEEMFNLRTSRISAYVYLVSLLLSTFMSIDSINSLSLSVVAVNLYTVFTPLYFCVGVYYLICVKWKREHKKPIFLFICAALALFGAVQLLLLYVAVSGAYYSASKHNA